MPHVREKKTTKFRSLPSALLQTIHTYTPHTATQKINLERERPVGARETRYQFFPCLLRALVMYACGSCARSSPRTSTCLAPCAFSGVIGDSAESRPQRWPCAHGATAHRQLSPARPPRTTRDAYTQHRRQSSPCATPCALRCAKRSEGPTSQGRGGQRLWVGCTYRFFSRAAAANATLPESRFPDAVT